MANPINVTCPKDIWTKVASNITSGVVKIIDTRPNLYLETYRINADPSPANNDGANPVDSNRELIIQSSLSIDIYIQPVGADGEVRVDI